MTIVTVVAVWTLLSIPFGILVGKCIAAADDIEQGRRK